MGMSCILTTISMVGYSQKAAMQIDTVGIKGSCEMCKARIENAGSMKKNGKVNWDLKTQKAILKYNPSNTTQEEMLKKIALAGYDNDMFLAPDDAYNKLPGCCKYERRKKSLPVQNAASGNHSQHKSEPMDGMTGMDGMDEKKEVASSNEFGEVFNSYFEIKDALIESDVNQVSAAAQKFVEKAKAVKMEKLDPATHDAWMKIMSKLIESAINIKGEKNIENQRMEFIELSKKMLELAKVAGMDYTLYNQHCPMANGGKGATWLSKESTIKNPYYGAKMISCGKTIETIK